MAFFMRLRLTLSTISHPPYRLPRLEPRRSKASSRTMVQNKKNKAKIATSSGVSTWASKRANGWASGPVLTSVFLAALNPSALGFSLLLAFLAFPASPNLFAFFHFPQMDAQRRSFIFPFSSLFVYSFDLFLFVFPFVCSTFVFPFVKSFIWLFVSSFVRSFVRSFVHIFFVHKRFQQSEQ